MYKRLFALAAYDEYYVCAMFLCGFVLCDPAYYQGPHIFFLLIHLILALGMLGVRYIMRFQAHGRFVQLIDLDVRSQVCGWILACGGSYIIHRVCDGFWILASFLFCLCLVLGVYQWMLQKSRCA